MYIIALLWLAMHKSHDRLLAQNGFYLWFQSNQQPMQCNWTQLGPFTNHAFCSLLYYWALAEMSLVISLANAMSICRDESSQINSQRQWAFAERSRVKSTANAMQLDDEPQLGQFKSMLFVHCIEHVLRWVESNEQPMQCNRMMNHI